MISESAGKAKRFQSQGDFCGPSAKLGSSFVVNQGNITIPSEQRGHVRSGLRENPNLGLLNSAAYRGRLRWLFAWASIRVIGDPTNSPPVFPEASMKRFKFTLVVLAAVAM